MIDATRSFPFTASQWQELEQQALVFRYFVSGVPVPPDLISTVITTPAAFNSLYSSSSSRLFPLQQPSLPIGWGCFQMGYGSKVDPEPGRCRRTDGKKWRCSKEAFPDSKYCERHMHRGKSKAKKLLQFQPFNTTTTTTTAAATTTNSKVAPPQQPPAAPPTMRACGSSFYPFLSPNSPSSSNSGKQQPCDSTISTQNHATPLWLLDPELYYDQPNKDIRYLHEMKGGGVGERMIGSGTSRIKMNTSTSSGCSSEFAFREHKIEESLNVDVKEEDESKKKAFHHFLGDYDHIRSDSGSRSYKLSTPFSSQTPYYRL